MANLKTIIRAIKEADRMTAALDAQYRRNKTLNNLIGCAHDEKFISIANFGIGSAIELAKQYNLEFAIGTCYGDCRAVLNKADWQSPLNESLPPTEYGTLFDMPLDEIDNIAGFGETIEVAVLRCLLNARVAGVL